MFKKKTKTVQVNEKFFYAGDAEIEEIEEKNIEVKEKGIEPNDVKISAENPESTLPHTKLPDTVISGAQKWKKINQCQKSLRFLTYLLIMWFVLSGRADAVANQNGKTYALFINGMSSDAAGTDAMEGVSCALKHNKLYGTDFTDTYVNYDSQTDPVSSEVLREGIRQAYFGATEEDLCIFYYFGHTFNGMGLSTQFDPSRKMYNSLPFSLLADSLSEVKCGTMLVILDCCFSEGFINQGIMFLDDEKREKFVVLVSSLFDEKSQFKLDEYSRFSKAIYSGLSVDDASLYADMDHDQVVTAKELYDYSHIRMVDDLLETKAWSKKNVWDDQMPQLYPKDSEFPVYSNQEPAGEGKDPGDTETSDSEAVQVVSNIKSMPYIGGTMWSQVVLMAENRSLYTNSLSLCGVVGAVYIDVDFDGVNEIFSVTYEPSDVMEEGKNSLRLLILENVATGWMVQAETEILSKDREENLIDASAINEGITIESVATVFVRRYKDNFEVYYEEYGEGVFATGQEWFFRGYRYDGSSFSLIEETDNMEWLGSPITMLWSNTEDLTEYGFSSDDVSMMKRYRALGFAGNDISKEVMSSDYIDGAYRVINIYRDCNVSSDVRFAWYNNPDGPLDCFQIYLADDSSNVPENLKETHSGVEVDIEEGEDTEYILPGYAEEYLDQVIQYFDSAKAQLAINEIYARHGRVFVTPEYDEYFRQQSWYQPEPGKTDEEILSEFNEFETHNMDLLIGRLQ